MILEDPLVENSKISIDASSPLNKQTNHFHSQETKFKK